MIERKTFSETYIRLLCSLLESLPQIGAQWRDLLRRFVLALHTRRRESDECDDSVRVPPSVYKRADPLLYSQSYLMAQGLSVTWDNPDIQLLQNGQAVSSSQLQANQEYDVVVRIWNNSYHAPAVGLCVSLSFLSFGIGMTSTHVGKTFVNLGAKGTSLHPAFAHFKWRTPIAEGHYCLQAHLDWLDDANPDNNLGQENTQVGHLHSPARFEFPVRNNTMVEQHFEMEADFYTIAPLRPCPEDIEVERTHLRLLDRLGRGTMEGERPLTRLQESRLLWRYALSLYRYSRFPVTTDWLVRIEPQQFTLQPREQQQVTVTVEPRTDGFQGRQVVNIHGFGRPSANAPRHLIGGVTLYVEGN